VNSALALHYAEVLAVHVQVHLRQRVKLRQKFSYVRMFSCGVLVWVSDREEQTIGEVEFTGLQQNWALGEWVQSDEEMINNSRARVMRSVMEPFLRVINSQHVVTLLKGSSSLFGPQGPHRELQLSIVILICQINLRRWGKVYEYPWHHRVLCSIRIRPPRYIVQLHQILKVRHFVGVPFWGVPVSLDHLLGVGCRRQIG
jgi:hypothetical protein